MSVKTEIDRINSNIAAAYTAIQNDGGTIPSNKNSANLAAAIATILDNRPSDIPSGTIVMWNGTESNVPQGWHLCDGSNGTPDLRGKFVLSANATYKAKTSGGASSVALSEAQLRAHTHTYVADDGTVAIPQLTGDINVTLRGAGTVSKNTGSTGFSSAINIMPPYYALCYIMKL